MEIKICGIQDAETAYHCEKEKVRFLGFNFYPKSPRYIDPLMAEEIIAELDPNTNTVGIFVDATLEELNEAPTDFVQIYGHYHPKDMEKIEKKIIKAIRIDEEFDPLIVDLYLPYVAYFLFDGPKNGEPFDWMMLKQEIPRHIPFFVAGGLTTENIEQAVTTLTPFGVDVASGVETDGEKDLQKITAFCKLVNL